MSVTEGQKYKLLVLQVRFLREKLKVHEATFEIASTEFSKEYDRLVGTLPKNDRDVIEKAGQYLDPPKIDISQLDDKIDVPIKPKKEMSKKFKKLFREVVKNTHPDKLSDLSEEEKQIKTELFERASKALKENDYAELVDVASQLYLTIEDPGAHEIKKIKYSIQEAREKMKHIESTVAWTWYHLKNVERSNYIKNYIQHIYNETANR